MKLHPDMRGRWLWLTAPLMTLFLFGLTNAK